jgi:hypothetical protein
LIVTGAVPVDVTVTVFVMAVPTETLPNANEVALTLRPGVAALSFIAKLFDEAFAVAAIVAVCEVVTVAAFAVNEVVDVPEATVTVAGTVTALLLLATVTLTPVEGAAELSDTVHVVVPAPVNEVLPHERALIEGFDGGGAAVGAIKLIEVVLAIVPRVAVSFTLSEVVTADTPAAKFALDSPEGTETETGTDTALLLLARFTEIPPLGAAAPSLTVHVSEPAPVIDKAVQVRLLSEVEGAAPLPCSLIQPPALLEEWLDALTLSWPVESVAEGGS